MMEKMKQTLMERGYTEKQAAFVASDLLKLDDNLKNGLQRWLVSGEETDYTIEGVRLSELKRKFGMTYPAALLSMDWIVKEPELAMKSINRGIR